VYGSNNIDYSREERHQARQSKNGGVAHFIDYFVVGGMNTTNKCRIKLFNPHSLNIIPYGDKIVKFFY
jgi:hypothetical protein